MAEVAAVYDVPLRVRFRGLTRRDGMLLRGEAGWAEFSPFWEYGPEEASSWLLAALEAADTPLPAPVRDAVPVNVTVPAVDAATAHQIVTASGGCRTAKVKVAEAGQSLTEEIARLEAVRDAIGPGGKIRIDVNARWTLEEAIQRVPELDRAAGGLEYAEQPVAAVEDLAALRRAIDVPIAADESIRRASDPLRVRQADAADVVVLKVQPIGGVRACLRLAEQIGIPVVVSSALESSVGLGVGVALAAALTRLPHACGLATGHLLGADTVPQTLLPADGALPVTRPAPVATATGPEPTPNGPVLDENSAAGPQLAANWRERLDACIDALVSRADVQGGVHGDPAELIDRARSLRSTR